MEIIIPGIPVSTLVPKDPRTDESDNGAATFWITNANNSWIENVAAGSESSG